MPPSTKTREVDAHRVRDHHERPRLPGGIRKRVNQRLSIPNLLENCVDIYKRCDEANPRLCNQAFFTKIYVDEDDDLHVEYARPYEMLLDPEINDNALTWAQNADKARTQPNDSSGKGSSLVRGVDLPKRFSNKRPALKSLIRRVLKGSERHGPRSRTPERHDTRGLVTKNSAKSHTRLTPERRAALVLDYEAGMPVGAIAAKHGIHRGSIPKIVVSAGVPLRSSGLNGAARSRALALYDEGLTLQEVADSLGADDKTVRNAIVALGGKIRPRGRRTNVGV